MTILYGASKASCFFIYSNCSENSGLKPVSVKICGITIAHLTMMNKNMIKVAIFYRLCVGMVAPKFQQFLKSVVAGIGKEALFECQILGEPVPVITWSVIRYVILAVTVAVSRLSRLHEQRKFNACMGCQALLF